MVVLACVNKAAFIFLQSLGKPWVSTGLSMVREIVFGVGLTVLFPAFWGLEGLLWSMPASDALTFVISLVVIVMAYRELGQGPATAAPVAEAPLSAAAVAGRPDRQGHGAAGPQRLRDRAPGRAGPSRGRAGHRDGGGPGGRTYLI